MVGFNMIPIGSTKWPLPSTPFAYKLGVGVVFELSRCRFLPFILEFASGFVPRKGISTVERIPTASESTLQLSGGSGSLGVGFHVLPVFRTGKALLPTEAADVDEGLGIQN